MEDDCNNDILIKSKREELKDLNISIRKLEQELKILKDKRSSLNTFIDLNCNHKWIKEMDHIQYSKSYNLCVKCHTMRGLS